MLQNYSLPKNGRALSEYPHVGANVQVPGVRGQDKPKQDLS